MVKRNYAHQTFSPVSDKKIEKAEKQYGVIFCDDYKTFLKTDNGLIIEEEDHNDYDYGSEEQINEANIFFGLNDSPYYNFEYGLESINFKFHAFIYPVAVDAGGNVLVQIASGSRKGTLAMVDHELGSIMDDLVAVENYEYPDVLEGEIILPFKTFNEATHDQILDICFETCVLSHYPRTFKEHLTKIDKLYNEIARENKKRPKEVVNPKPELKRVVLYFFDGDKPYPFEEMTSVHGDIITVQPDEAIGWLYKVTMEETKDIQVHTKLVVDGKQTIYEKLDTIETNSRYRGMLSMRDDDNHLALSGSYELTISFPEESNIGNLKTNFEIVVGERDKNTTSALSFKPATEKQIAKLENKLPYTFCDDYRAWLTSTNGIHFFWPWIKLWKKTPKKRKAERYAEAKALGTNGDWQLAITEIYGLQASTAICIEHTDTPEFVDINRGLNNTISPEGFKQINPVLCPVSDDNSVLMGGWYQIVAGKHRGKVARCKIYNFELNIIFKIKEGERKQKEGKNMVTKSYPFQDVTSAEPDQIIDAYLAEDIIEITDMNFKEFSNAVINAHKAEFARFYDKYLPGLSKPKKQSLLGFITNIIRKT